MRDADVSEYGPPFATGKRQLLDGCGRFDRSEPELGTFAICPGGAPAIGPCVRLEIHAIRGS